jgi:hypothetical protein
MNHSSITTAILGLAMALAPIAGAKAAELKLLAEYLDFRGDGL